VSPRVALATALSAALAAALALLFLGAAPGFDARRYEANYSVDVSGEAGAVPVRVRGWLVVGVGPRGNYSYGELAASVLSFKATVTIKAATEGGALRFVACLDGVCRAGSAPANASAMGLLAGLLNVTRVEVGRCRHMQYEGTLLEERGVILPRWPLAPPGVRASYRGVSCAVRGVRLRTLADVSLELPGPLRARVAALRVNVTAVRVGAYSEEAYGRVLGEVREAWQRWRD
jgi:hypothetical protein